MAYGWGHLGDVLENLQPLNSPQPSRPEEVAYPSLSKAGLPACLKMRLRPLVGTTICASTSCSGPQALGARVKLQCDPVMLKEERDYLPRRL